MAAVASTPSINVSPPSHSASQSSSNTTTCTLVPQYPYNVSMPSFAGVLLPYERSPMPDDNDVQTRLPSRCVDYLSHNWDESDVWTSWKAMTRHKNEMANGVRLENASWRTWAKQRSNLKTISPETLNWLKDSDVTWLYGPLHTAVDPVPPPKISSIQDRFNLDGEPQSIHSQPPSAVNSRPGSSASVRSSKAPGKPILKHRSLSEILGVGLSRGGDSASEDGSEDGKGRPDQHKRARISIAHASSDSTLVKLGNAGLARGSSPTIINGYESSDLATSGEDSDVARRTSAMRGHNGPDDIKPKKHISFSHRVEQCIAVDSEEERGAYIPKNQLRAPSRAGAAVIGSNALEDDDDDDDEDDLLTFRSSAPRQAGLHAVSQRYSSPSTVGTMVEPYGPLAGTSNSLSGSSASEPFTIARMAPTTLKSSEVLPAPSPVVVYDRDPPSVGINSQPSYARPTYTVTATPSASIGMDYTMPNVNPQAPSNPTPVYSHQTSSSYSSRTYGPVAVSKVLPSPTASPSADHLTSMPIQYGSSSSINHWNVSTPDDEDTEEFTAMGFDYFSGPDLGLGDEYDMSRLPSQHLASFQAGFDPSDMSGKPGNNEDSTLLRSILKTHVISPSPGSPVNSPAKFEAQDAILVPQVKSNHKSSAAHSSSSSSLSSSPFSPRHDSSSSLATLPNDHSILNPDKSQPITAECPQNDPARHSRGRSSSRGSSASSFERSSTDKRTSSYSPTHSPPLKSSGSCSNLAASSSNSILGNISRSSNRPGGNFIRANSYDGGRSFSSKSTLIHAPIGEEDESEDQHAPAKASHGSLEKSLNNSSFRAPGSSTTLPSTSAHPPHKISSTESLRNGKTSAPLHHSPCLISQPKLASAQLNGSLFLPQSDGCESSSGDGDRGSSNPSSTHNESIVSGSPTLFSLLSKQGNNSAASWWSDDRPGNRTTARQSPERQPARPSLRSCNSDSSTSTFIGRTSFSQNDRKFMGTSRGGSSVDEIRCSSEDEFGFGNYYGPRSPEDEEDLPRDESDNSGMISRAVDIVETAKVIVGALWNAGSRSIWGTADPDNSQAESGDHKDGRLRAHIRRASTGAINHRPEDGSTVPYQNPIVLDKQRSRDETS
ncbi:hypothetical protein H4Q26_012233 [Puccinia striiformis f. sp. tritici PST-130]|nr:hypothetical protein Pst134EB_006493 [Puccinia striiformis f. sp. tritici]KAI9618974.1 hypothetical protein H4Q26_012233 [Puccinia striiformis f. sp. tritici PST-130]